VRAKTFSLAASGAFASFGVRSVIEPPVRLAGEARISIGDDVFVGAGSTERASQANACSRPRARCA
jgi:hypothetical protein